MKPRHKRMAAIAFGVIALGVATALVLQAFQKNLVFFFSPTQVAAKELTAEELTAEELTAARTAAAGRLEKLATAQINELAMNVRFKVVVSPQRGEAAWAAPG